MSKHCSRGNIFVKQPGGGVYLYTQNRGDKLPKILKEALIRGRSKWGNTAVMTRIIFGEMVQSDVMNLDGFAISTQLSDNDFYVLVLDDARERVGIFNESGHHIRKYTYEEFILWPDSKLDWVTLAGGMRPETHDYDTSVPAPVTPGTDPYNFPGDEYKLNKQSNAFQRTIRGGIRGGTGVMGVGRVTQEARQLDELMERMRLEQAAGMAQPMAHAAVGTVAPAGQPVQTIPMPERDRNNRG